jgi:outer membrane protein assembly factor BamB/DNA-binding MarR family transcriptional regulator
MYRSDAQHTGACGSGIPPELSSPFRVWLGEPGLTTPVAAGGRIFAISAGGTLFSVWADTGGLAWKRSLGGNCTADPAVDGETVYVLTVDGGVLAFDTACGAPAWNATLPAGLGYTLPLVFHNGSLLVTTTSGTVMRVSTLEAGRELWRSDGGARIKGPVTVGGGKAYMLVEGGRARALDIESGNVSWTSEPGMGSNNDFPSAYIQGRLYIGTRGTEVFCRDTSNGSLVWTKPLKSAVTGAPAIGDGIIVFGTRSGLVYALNLSDGSEAWPKAQDLGSNITLSPALAGGMVLVGNADGDLYRLLASSGQLTATLAVGAGQISSPVVSEGRIILSTADGALLIIGGHANGPWAVLDIPRARVSTGEPVRMSGAGSTAAEGVAPAYYWFDFGDGRSSGWVAGPAVNHSFAQKGRYVVSLKVRDANGTESRECRGDVEVFNERPSVSPVLPATARVDRPVAFSAAASDPDGRILLYQWDFEGDGTFDWSGPSMPEGFNHTYPVNGTYHPVVRVQDDNGSYASASGALEVLPAPVRPPASPRPGSLSLPAAAASVSLVSLAAAGACLSLTDFGKYRFFTLFIVPLYVRLKRDEVLDNYTRGKIHGYIIANPGDNYNSIRDALELSNGIVAHHLHTLEREGLVQSMRDGMYRRFFPANAKLPPEDEGHFNIQKRIVAVIRDNPGISQKEIALKVGVSSPTVNYHVSVLSTARMIRIEKFGRRTRCFVLESQPPT